jgi:hypothetical protein
MAQKLTYFFMATGGVGATPDGTIPANAVPCTEEQYQNSSAFEINYGTMPPSIVAVAAATALQNAQSQQIMVLQNACESSIYSGYQSTALGSAYLYPAKATDQMNMLSSLVSALGIVVFTAQPWAPNTPVVEGQMLWLNFQLYTVTKNGTTGETMPAIWPQVAESAVIDGDAQWELWTTPFWCADLSQTPPAWAFRDHTLQQIWRVGMDAKGSVLNDMGTNTFLAAQVEAATTIQQVEAIQWP